MILEPIGPGMFDHADRHQLGGADLLALDTLGTPSDNTNLNASASYHGLLPKLSGNVGDVLRGDGTWGAGGGASHTLGSATHTDVVFSGEAHGDLLYRGATQWNNLGPGTSGQALVTGGAGADPAWTSLDHTTHLANVGTNTHAQIDSHIASTSNPHSTSIANIGGGTLLQLNTAISDATLDDISGARTPTAHASSHENGGGDEISVAGLSGLLADGQTPLAHASTHENGGADEISVAGLSGLLADGQTPLAHATSHKTGGSDVILLDEFGTPTDNTNLNATTSYHGLLPKLGGGTANFLRADGTWASPDGGTPAAHASTHANGGGDAVDHNTLSNLTTGDVHTHYALLAGRAGGQLLVGGTGNSENLLLRSTTGGTKGYVGISGGDFRVLSADLYVDSGEAKITASDAAKSALEIVAAANYTQPLINVFASDGTTPKFRVGAEGSANDNRMRGYSSGHSGAVLWYTYSNNGNDQTSFTGARALNTQASPNPVGAATTFVGFVGAGYDGTAFRNAVKITMEADGTIGTNIVPTKIIAWTSPTGSATPVEGWRLDSSQQFIINSAGSAPIGANLLQVRASVGHTGKLQEWQNSGGTPLSYVNATGAFSFSSGGGIGASGFHFGADTDTGGSIVSANHWAAYAGGQKIADFAYESSLMKLSFFGGAVATQQTSVTARAALEAYSLGVTLVADAPAAHASTHQSGGSDSIKLDDFATPDDNTDLNATTTYHGLMPKLNNDSSYYLDGTGAWSVPTGGAPHTFGSGTHTDIVFTGEAQGDIVYRNATQWVNLAPGTSGYALVTAGAAANPAWTQLDHTTHLSNVGTNTHAQIDSHISATNNPHSTSHGDLGDLGVDDHSQYFLLAGRAGGQVAYGGTAANEDLTLLSTFNATGGSVIIKGRGTQADNILEVQNNSGTHSSVVTAAGVLEAKPFTYTTGAGLIVKPAADLPATTYQVLMDIQNGAGASCVQFKHYSSGAWMEMVFGNTNNQINYGATLKVGPTGYATSTFGAQGQLSQTTNTTTITPLTVYSPTSHTVPVAIFQLGATPVGNPDIVQYQNSGGSPLAGVRDSGMLYSALGLRVTEAASMTDPGATYSVFWAKSDAPTTPWFTDDNGDDYQLTYVGAAPTAHAASHQSGGGDAIKLDDLDTPDDNTDLNATTTYHGLLPKLNNDSSYYLDGTGAWSVPTGGSPHTFGSGTHTDIVFTGEAQGDLVYRNATQWVNLAPGTSGYALVTGGAGANPAWTQLDHATHLTSIGTNTHAQIDTHIGSTANPHSTSLDNLTDTTLAGTARGDLLVRGAAVWGNVAIGTVNYALVSNGTDPAWAQLDHTVHLSNIGSNTHAQIDSFMSAHASRHIDGGADPIDGDKIEITWVPSNYTRSTTPTEVDQLDQLTAHLYGIDQAIGGGASHTFGSATHTDIVFTGEAQGDIVYRNATQWVNLPYGTSGYALTTNGVGANPSWAQLDHGVALTGLNDDDHTQYALLAGRAGGQTLIGGTADTNNLTLQATSTGSGNIIAVHPVLGPNGTSAAPTFGFSGDLGNGMYLNAADTLGWAINGNDRMTLTSSAFSISANCDLAILGGRATITENAAGQTALLVTAADLQTVPTAIVRAGSTPGAVNLFEVQTSAPVAVFGVNNSGDTTIAGAINHDGSTAGFFSVAPQTQPSGVTVTSAVQTLGLGASLIQEKLDDLATPDDNTDLNASTSYHGLLPKLSGTATDYLDGSGNWSTPAGGSHTLGSATHTDVSFSGTARGDLIYRNASNQWANLAVGTATYSLVSDGTDFAWAQVDHVNLANKGTNTHAQIDSHISATNNPHSTSHGDLGDLGVDDHSQYALLAGRAGGQILIGGTAATDDLLLQATSNGTPTGASVIVAPDGTNKIIEALDDGTDKLAFFAGTPVALSTLTSVTARSALESLKLGVTLIADTPAAHATSHKTGGSDVILLDEFGTPTDNTNLNATTTYHGLMPKLNNDSAYYLDGTGAWSIPAGGGTHTFGSATHTDVTFSGEAQGDLVYRGASAWNNLAIGTTNYALVSNGTVPGWAQLDHTVHLSNVGSNTHAQIDTAITNSSNHIASTSNPHSTSLDNLTDTTLAGTARGDLLVRGAAVWGNVAIGTTNYALVSNGTDPAWAQLDHTTHLANVGSNTHAQIDTAITNSANHIASTSNPHSTSLDNLSDTTLSGTARGDILFRGVSNWNNLAAGGTAGYALTTGGVGADPSWAQLDHGAALTGLLDDDHTIYLLADGTRAMSGELQVPAGSVGDPSVHFTGALTSGMYYSSGVAFAFGGAQVLHLDGTDASFANPIDLTALAGTAEAIKFTALSGTPNVTFAPDAGFEINKPPDAWFRINVGGTDYAVAAFAIV